jgi:hypothetical protein
LPEAAFGCLLFPQPANASSPKPKNQPKTQKTKFEPEFTASISQIYIKAIKPPVGNRKTARKPVIL